MGSAEIVAWAPRRGHRRACLAVLLFSAVATIAPGSVGIASGANAPAVGSAPTLQSAPPVSSAPPEIKGHLQKGATLEGGPGVWSGAIGYAYQWLRCDSRGANCSIVPSAKKASYRLVEADVGSTLILQVRADGPGGSATALSRRTAQIVQSEDKAREIFLVCIALIAGLGALLYKLFIGFDNRLSTSKVTAAVWTYFLAAAVLGFIVTKFWGDSRGLDSLMHSGLAGQYGLLIGGPLGAAIAAKGIVGTQTSSNSAAKPRADSPKLRDVIHNDGEEADLGDVQYVLFNFVAMVYFVGSVIQSPTLGMPHIPDVLLGLTSVAALGYVAKKALPPPTATAKLAQAQAKPGDAVTITGTNLLSGEEPDATPLIVLFGLAEGTVTAKHHDAGTMSDTITVTVPGEVRGNVQVVVVTPAPTLVKAGQLEVQAPAQPAPAQPLAAG